MSFTLRRSQSLKSLSGGHSSWSTSEIQVWDKRRSVSQLVQKYESCVALTDVGREEAWSKSSGLSKVETLWRRYESLSGANRTLSRSISTEMLPQPDRLGTNAARSLFESKNALRQDYASSPRLNVTPQAKSNPVNHITSPRREAPTGREKGYSSATTVTTIKKDKAYQKDKTFETTRRRTISGVPGYVTRSSSGLNEEKRRFKTDLKESSYQEHKQTYTYSPIPTVKDRSVLYLSKVAAADFSGFTERQGSVVQEHLVSSRKKKQSKMAEVAKEKKVTDAASGDDDLPPPPPPLPRPQVLESIQQDLSQNFLPVPPPKETFTEFYQQQQKSELKRLLKHIHPALKMNLDDVVDDELIEAINPQAVETAYQGEVQSMRWIFENWTLDNIGSLHETKKLLDEENLQGGDVRGKSSLFEHSVFDGQHTTVGERPGLVKGDVRTATWLFETQSLDSISRSKMEDEEFVEVLLKEPIQKGDVRGAHLLFESKPLDALGRCCSVEDQHFLTLKSELQEHKGDVKKTVKLFQADPCCALRDSSGNIHEIKSICREEIQSSNFKTARWLFETQPLDLINKGTTGVQIIRGISLEEAQKSGFDKKRWMFETQPLDAIQEGAVEEQKFQGTVEDFSGEAGVCNKLKLFENQPLLSLKGESTGESSEKETIVGGNVGSTLWLFETQPMDTLKDSYEVGHLKKFVVSSNEKGEVRDKKQQFEKFSSCKMTLDRKIKVEDVEKGDVNTFKNLFETIPLSHISPSENAQTQVNDITAGDVKGNCSLFETIPLYAIKDCAGNFHEVTTVSREECIKGNVQNYKWMFETKPLDQFEEGNEKLEIIKGITRQEDMMGDVRTAKWMFETQSLDCIHLKFNQSEVDSTVPQEELQKGNVKTCKWLFETQPMDILYDKSERNQDVQVVPKANVKSHTWLFETQPLDNIKDKEEFSLKLCSTVQEDVKNDMNVKTVKHLFETETLDKITKRTDSVQNIRYVSQVDVQSGDVSRVKEIFESKSLDEIGSECIKESNTEEQNKEIQTESVHKFTWLFENQPISDINEKEAGITHRVSDVEGGDVGSKKFIFETFSLDKIQDNDQLLEHQSMSVEKPMSGSVNVKSSTMLFESKPLYALRDKDGQFHEVTTVKKEEMVRGDVRGARWMFETKPLDTIQADKDIYVIRAVTQEDVLKGDVKSARWKFETQPLDSFTPREGSSVRVVDEIGHGQNVQQSKQHFETEQVAQKNYVRMVSVTDIQQGDVRTSTWLFENQRFDTLKGEPHEQNTLQTVHREDNTKGDVKRCTWLFESQALDKIKNNESTEEFVSLKEEIPKADVKSTTWLFETTPLDKITVESVTDILYRLSHKSFIHSNGIIIQAYDYKYVNMAKYQFVNNEDPKVQKEEVVEGNIRNIMLQLLFRPNLKPKVVLLKEDEQGKVHSTVIEIPFQQPGSAENPDAECKTQEAAKIIENLLVQQKTIKTGLVIQESEGGQTEMTVYSLLSQRNMTTESYDVTRGDIKSTIGSLLASVHSQQTKPLCRLEENERGNVDLYRNCIEKGDLCYLKSLQEEEPTCSWREQIEIVQGDVNEAKRHLNQQREEAERTILDVVPGDVKSVKKVFTKVCTDLSVGNCIPKEEIVRGDVLSVKQQLDEALKQPFMVQKEEIVFGDIKATLESLERAKQQSLHVEREVIIPGTIYDLNVEAQEMCLDENEGKLMKKEIISGDVKAAKRSLERAKNQRIEREPITPGKLYNLNGNLNEFSQDQNTSTVQRSTTSSMSNQRITTTFRKVSETEKDQGSTERACHQNEEGRREDAIGVSTENGSTMLENNPQFSELEPEIVRGDVKASIQSLQSAATEQRSLDREEIVRGNMQETLQSLERSSINISKGDYKAAMLYRKSGQSNIQSKVKNDSGTQECKSFVIPLPIADAELSSSVSVTGSEHLTVLTLNSEPMISYNLEKSNQLSCTFANQGEHPPPIPPKSSHQVKDQKPVIPPKPLHITTNSGSPYICPSSPEPVINHQQTPAIPSKLTPSKKTFLHKNETWNFESSETSNKIKDKSCNSYEPVERTKDPMDLQKMQYTQQWLQNSHMEHMNTPSVSKIENVDGSSFACDGAGIEKNVIQKINAAEEIRMCMQSYSKDNEEVNIGFKVALQNFGERKTASVGNTSSFPKKIKVVTNEITPKQDKGFRENTNGVDLHLHIKDNRGETPATPEKPPSEYNQTCKELNNPEKKVVLREKKGRRETEDERRQRLSVHKEEIMRGNVKAAMEIFENLMRREELKIILSKVQEIEGETCEVDVNSLKTLFENVPAWIASPTKNRKHRYDPRKTRASKEKEELRDDVESVSSVEAAFEDLEKASMDIINLKEQTLAKLLDIEEAIKKALYSVSNLKSEADIAGLSGLFSESLNDDNVSPSTNKIRKISIVSSKANPVQSKLVKNTDNKNEKPELPKEVHQLQMGKLPSSPSFISIHSAARKPAESPTPKTPHYSVEKSYTSHICSPQSPRRKVSILEVQTVPDVASGIIGTKTVSEKYEETDCFGNKYFSSKRSTFVTRQSETELSSSYDVVTNPGRYEVMTSPILQRSGHTYSSNSLCKSKDSKVFVTFSHPNTEKH
ncbi:xin actin-binding repeat-containing protein 1-like isoform X2 [Myxocyprinus asiaticus]|uniref:xin actin-binding repeat-containing protein 1-like isoform X2 n=2 Tax=Myxocyprinus asiaticus TaxID=70543 RepID=UPI002221CB88|nr:xin actin-binding repeat-containing protein 1-like isoform X2 [Myxocyprinus asiaticus]